MNDDKLELRGRRPTTWLVNNKSKARAEAEIAGKRLARLQRTKRESNRWRKNFGQPG